MPSNTSSEATASTQQQASGSKKCDSFWDTLLKLDQVSSKKGKSVARSHSSVGSLKEAAEAGSQGQEDDLSQVSFESTPFGQLLAMLSSPVIRRNSVLTDKLLRLLSLIR